MNWRFTKNTFVPKLGDRRYVKKFIWLPTAYYDPVRHDFRIALFGTVYMIQYYTIGFFSNVWIKDRFTFGSNTFPSACASEDDAKSYIEQFPSKY